MNSSEPAIVRYSFPGTKFLEQPTEQPATRRPSTEHRSLSLSSPTPGRSCTSVLGLHEAKSGVAPVVSDTLWLLKSTQLVHPMPKNSSSVVEMLCFVCENAVFLSELGGPIHRISQFSFFSSASSSTGRMVKPFHPRHRNQRFKESPVRKNGYPKVGY